jgi:hypothetical protein
VAKEWAGRVGPGALTKLERFRFIAQVTHEGRLSAPFALGGVQVEDVIDKPEDAGRVEGATAGRSVAEVTEHLETLDDRIQAALEEKRAKGGADAQFAGGSQSSATAPQEEGEGDE